MNNIKAAREAAKMSQKYVAMSLGVKGPSVSNWESGKTMPTPDNLAALANLFGVSVDYLLGRDDDSGTSDQDMALNVSSRAGYGKTKISPETMSTIEGILNKLAQLDEEDRKIAESHIDFLLDRKKGE